VARGGPPDRRCCGRRIGWPRDESRSRPGSRSRCRRW
jgi:hypothetical protein